MSDGDPKADFLDGFTLSPDWAKKSSESYTSNLNKYSSRNEWEPSDTRRGKAPFRRDGNRGDSRGRDDERRQRPRDRSERPAFGDAPRRDLTAPPAESPRRELGATQQEDSGRPRRNFDRRDRQPPPPVPFDIRFLPDQKALSVIARKVQSGHRAIPLRDLVKLFFDNPESVEVRLEFNAENKDRRFYTCRKCGWFALSEDALRGHILSTHFNEYFDSETITVDPPTGNFTGVGRCGFTGKLLAPPNHHSYNKIIQQMLRVECAGTSEETYRSRIELINTPEAIEQWKQEASQQIVYFAKPDPENARKRTPQKKAEPVTNEESLPEEKTKDEALQADDQPQSVESAEPAAEVETAVESDPVADEAMPVDSEPVQKMSAEEAEDLFSRTLMPKMMKAERQVTVTHAVSKMVSDNDILGPISRAWDREQTIQTASLFFAVRGGLRSRKLALFRASDPRREEFVIHKAPTVLDPAHAVPELKQIIDYLTEHPGCTKTSMLAELIPADASPEAAEAVLKQVAFFIERGHMIEYFNGVLALAAKHPYYSDPSVKKKQPRKPKINVPHVEAAPASVAPEVAVTKKPKSSTKPAVASDEPPVSSELASDPKPVVEVERESVEVPVVPEPTVEAEELPVEVPPIVETAPDPEPVVEGESEPVEAAVEPELIAKPDEASESVAPSENVESPDENAKTSQS